MRVVCISDTHTMGRRVAVPDGDVLIHAGDHTLTGTKNELFDAFRWLNKLPHKHKVTIAGNHDLMFENEPLRARGILRSAAPTVTYLEDNLVEIEGYKFYGSPWTPYFQGNWRYRWVFNLPQYDYEAYKKHWAQVPDETDVLITHGPPRNFGDSNVRDDPRKSFGDIALMLRLAELPNLKLHVFGHIHGGYGKYQAREGLTLVNAAACTEEYKPTNPPIVIDLP